MESENNEHYQRIISKYGDIKIKIVELLYEKNYEEISKLWNSIRTEARFFVTPDVFKKNITYYMYCGIELQEDIIDIINKYGITESDYTKITKLLV